MTKSRYAIPSILAVGFLPASAVAADTSNHISTEKSMIDDIVEHAQSISEMHKYELAQHRSHQSHASHASHSSHRSFALPEPPDFGPRADRTEESAPVAVASLTGRNEMSTPRQHVLPSSPKTAMKPKVLKGNTKKFAEIVSRVQLALITKGYDVGVMSGDLDAKTVAALYKFQRANGLPPTGKLEERTLSNLGVVAE